MIKDSGRNLLMLGAPPLAATFIFWLIRLNEITLVQFVSAAALLSAAWVPYYRWKVVGERNLPIFPMISFMFWVYYALPLFWGDRWNFTGRQLSDDSVEQAMILAVTGVLCLFLGKWTGLGRRMLSRKLPDIELTHESTWAYIRTALLLSIPVTFGVQSSAYLFGGGARQVLMILGSTVPLALFVLMFRKLLRRQVNHGEILLTVVFLISRLAAGIASGWLGMSVAIMVICGVVYLYERRRIPTSAIVIVCLYVLFFQVGKDAFRRTFWSERVDASLSEKISFWSSESLNTWETTLTSSDRESWHRLADRSLARMSLLQQTAHVLELTPAVVPYQHGRLYSYMLVTLIPRALWEDKPSVNDANRFYQVAYGLTSADDLGTVSIAVGTLTESFINFGWWGPFLIMVPVGIFFDFFQHAFLARNSGWVLNAIGIALIPNFLSLESQLAQYLGGILQCIAVALVVLWPVVRVKLRVQATTVPLSKGEGVPRMLPAFARRFF